MAQTFAARDRCALDRLPVTGAGEGPAAEAHGVSMLLVLGMDRHHRAHPSRALHGDDPHHASTAGRKALSMKPNGPSGHSGECTTQAGPDSRCLVTGKQTGRSRRCRSVFGSDGCCGRGQRLERGPLVGHGAEGGIGVALGPLGCDRHSFRPMLSIAGCSGPSGTIVGRFPA